MSGAWRRCLGLARSLMVTPWFAAGAGIVIAAALAVDSPSALTYAPSGPETRCPAGGCTGAAPGHGPDLAIATPGAKVSSGAAPGEAPAVGPAVVSGPAPVYQVGYQILRRWPSGFDAVMTLPGNLRRGAWTLQFAFSSAHVDGVSGARWQPSGNGDGGTASGPWRRGRSSRDWGGGPGGGGAGPGHLTGNQLMVTVSGTPAAPSGCTLDGAGCRFG